MDQFEDEILSLRSDKTWREKTEGKITTNLHIEPADRHQCLRLAWFHPNQTKPSIVYCQALRVSVICSMECDFHKHISEMKTWVLIRGYPKNLVESEMKKCKNVKILISYTWKKKSKKCFIQFPWFHFEEPRRLVATL